MNKNENAYGHADSTMLGEVVSFKNEIDDLRVEYDVLTPVDIININDSRQVEIVGQIDGIDALLDKNQAMIDEVNLDIDRLTNHADGIDYAVAVGCGVLTGLIDAFFVGEFDFVGSREKVGEKFDQLVSKKANELREKEVKQKTEEAIKKAKQAAEDKGKTLSDEEIKKIQEKFSKKLEEPLDTEKSIKFLEERFHIPSDSVYEKTNEEINNKIKKIVEDAQNSGKPLSNEEIKQLKEKMKTKISHDTHHLDDLTHHPSVLGLAASIAQQFGAKAVFQNRDGKIIRIKVEQVKIVRKGKETIEIRLIGDDLRSKLACGTVNWIMHLLSDVAGSSSSAAKGNAGMGLPGPILTLLKEFSMIPGINKTNLPQKCYELFTQNQDFLDGYKMDLRSELAIGAELGKQAMPVFINSIFIRCFYFVRHFAQEVKANNGFKGLDVKQALKNSMPLRNRTVIRMLTISLGTFEAIDLGDAAIRGAINSGGTLPGFLGSFVLRVNFVGIGRFAIACGSDISMGVQREKQRNERIKLVNQQIYLLEAKVYYRQESMWVSAENAVEATDELCNYVENVIPKLIESNAEVLEGLKGLETSATELVKNNPEWANKMRKKLRR